LQVVLRETAERVATFTGEITAPKVATLEAMLELIGAVPPQGELAASVAAVVEPTPTLDSDTDQVRRRMLISRFTERPCCGSSRGRGDLQQDHLRHRLRTVDIRTPLDSLSRNTT
jgi:hypothetical protein